MVRRGTLPSMLRLFCLHWQLLLTSVPLLPYLPLVTLLCLGAWRRCRLPRHCAPALFVPRCPSLPHRRVRLLLFLRTLRCLREERQQARRGGDGSRVTLAQTRQRRGGEDDVAQSILSMVRIENLSWRDDSESSGTLRWTLRFVSRRRNTRTHTRTARREGAAARAAAERTRWATYACLLYATRWQTSVAIPR